MNKIDRLMVSMNISEDELISHAQAHQVFSTTSSETKLKLISQENRNKYAKFYKTLRDHGAYWTPGNKPQYLCTYVEGWKAILQNDPRSQGEYLTTEKVSDLLKNTVDEVIKNMKTINPIANRRLK